MRRCASQCRGFARDLASWASHTGVWAGLYVTGAVVCAAQLSGMNPGTPTAKLGLAAGFACTTATAVYLLDRVKLRDSWLDPADALAHPSRFAFVSRHAAALRVVMVCLLLLSSWLGEQLVVGGATVPWIAAAGVLLYAGRPRERRRRPKDVLFLKNAYVAVGIASFAGLVAWAVGTPEPGATSSTVHVVARAGLVIMVFVQIAGRVLADAVLCDLDDEHADRQYGTDTLPTALGRDRAWRLAFLLRMGLAAVLIISTPLPLWPRLAWAAVTAASSLTLWFASPARVRDWVDVRFAWEAIVVGVVLYLVPSQ